MEDTVKALEEKVALLEAKLGKKSESKAGASGSSPTTSVSYTHLTLPTIYSV